MGLGTGLAEELPFSLAMHKKAVPSTGKSGRPTSWTRDLQDVFRMEERKEEKEEEEDGWWWGMSQRTGEREKRNLEWDIERI